MTHLPVWLERLANLSSTQSPAVVSDHTQMTQQMTRCGKVIASKGVFDIRSPSKGLISYLVGHGF